MHVCMSSGIPGSCIANVVCSSNVFEALLLSVQSYGRNKSVFVSLLYSTINKLAKALIEHCTRSAETIFACLAASFIDSVSYSYASYILDCPCTMLSQLGNRERAPY